jgi:HTH-type transcriptional regulator/antitoxin HipB
MQSNVAERIGEIVRAERERQGLKQAELALAAGVSYRTVLQIEKGKPTSRLDVVIRVVEALGLTLEVRAASRLLAPAARSSSVEQRKSSFLTRFEIYREGSGSYRWRLKAPNGEVLATSASAYSTKATAERAARHVAATANTAAVD